MGDQSLPKTYFAFVARRGKLAIIFGVRFKFGPLEMS
jgi:hypothetical protein